MKKILTLFLLIFFFHSANGQSANKDVILITTGTGNTLEEAKQSALRNATEQAFGAFISSKTEMFNDVVVADQMSSVASGNIRSYEVLNENQLPNGHWISTLRTIVSIDKLTSFIQSKGDAVNINGELIAFEIKQQNLNAEGEFESIINMIGVLHEILQTSFNYEIGRGSAKIIDEESTDRKFDLTVKVIANNNMDFCNEYLNKQMEVLALSMIEKNNYAESNKAIFPITINSNNYYFRNKNSLIAIKSLFANWEFYCRNFEVESDFNRKFGNELHGTIPNFQQANFDFPQIGDYVAEFSWSENLSLDQIKKLKSDTVFSKGVISLMSGGGYVLSYKNGIQLIVAISDFTGNTENLLFAQKWCSEFKLSGSDIWRLPTSQELQFIQLELTDKRIGNFNSFFNYWSTNDKQSKIELEIIQPENRRKFDIYKVSYYNRYGERVFETSDYNIAWNGKVNNDGPMVPSGTYFYQLTYQFAGKMKVEKINGSMNLTQGKGLQIIANPTGTLESVSTTEKSIRAVRTRIILN